MTNTVTTQWADDYTFISSNEDQQSIVLDAAMTAEGSKKAPSPMEVVLMGLSACAGIDVKLILGKSKQVFSALKVTATGKRRDEFPKIYTDIHLNFELTGNDLSEKQVARAIKLSAEKYCSVSHMLQGVVNITHGYEIKNTDG